MNITTVTIVAMSLSGAIAGLQVPVKIFGRQLAPMRRRYPPVMDLIPLRWLCWQKTIHSE